MSESLLMYFLLIAAVLSFWSGSTRSRHLAVNYHDKKLISLHYTLRLLSTELDCGDKNTSHGFPCTPRTTCLPCAYKGLAVEPK